MSSELSKAARCWGLYDNEKIVGFCGVLHQPHGRHKNLKRCSRLVILPDYQGIGLGTKFLNIVSDHYLAEGFDFTIVTSAKNMVHALKRSNEWKCIRFNESKCSSKKGTINFNNSRTGVKTASFMRKRPSDRT